MGLLKSWWKPIGSETSGVLCHRKGYRRLAQDELPISFGSERWTWTGQVPFCSPNTYLFGKDETSKLLNQSSLDSNRQCEKKLFLPIEKETFFTRQWFSRYSARPPNPQGGNIGSVANLCCQMVVVQHHISTTSRAKISGQQNCCLDHTDKAKQLGS